MVIITNCFAGIFRLEELSYSHIAVILRHLYTHLGGHIPEGEILTDRAGVLSPLSTEVSLEDELGRIIHSYFGGEGTLLPNAYRRLLCNFDNFRAKMPIKTAFCYVIS